MERFFFLSPLLFLFMGLNFHAAVHRICSPSAVPCCFVLFISATLISTACLIQYLSENPKKQEFLLKSAHEGFIQSDKVCTIKYAANPNTTSFYSTNYLPKETSQLNKVRMNRNATILIIPGTRNNAFTSHYTIDGYGGKWKPEELRF